jgi:hypothetical protein
MRTIIGMARSAEDGFGTRDRPVTIRIDRKLSGAVGLLLGGQQRGAAPVPAVRGFGDRWLEVFGRPGANVGSGYKTPPHQGRYLFSAPQVVTRWGRAVDAACP